MRKTNAPAVSDNNTASVWVSMRPDEGRSIYVYLHKVQQGRRLQHRLKMFHQCLLCDSGSGHNVAKNTLQHAFTHLPIHTAVNHAPRTADETHIFAVWVRGW